MPPISFDSRPPFGLKIFAALVFICFVSCGHHENTNRYGYVFHESTGQNQYILIDAKEMPVRFDETNSNKLALFSLRSLSAKVLYPNAKGDKIFLLGNYDPKSQTFVLKHWYITVPFTEITLGDALQTPDEIREIQRRSLERTDFENESWFNPNSTDFDPREFQMK